MTPRTLSIHWATVALAALLGLTGPVLRADPPTASYIFPAGGQRGKTVNFRVGGLFLHDDCPFEMLGTGIDAVKKLKKTKTVWFEGPILLGSDAGQSEVYPKDYAGRVGIAADAPLGVRYWRVWNAQGAPPALKFAVGDLPEIVEAEIDGEPIPVAVQLPVTINGRIFPREDVDLWSFRARRGQTISCRVQAAALGSPLDSRLEILDATGKKLAENDDADGADSFLRFTAPADGDYQVRIQDVQFRGGQAYVYRLTITDEPTLDWVYPLGGQRGEKTTFELGWRDHALSGRVSQEHASVNLPVDGSADHGQRFSVQGKQSCPFLLELTDWPEHLEAEPNDEAQQSKLVAVPAILNGRIDKPGDVDHWGFTARKGDVYELDLRASRLGSPLAAVLVILDAKSKELARADAASAGVADPQLTFTAPADGTYLIRIAERFQARGGPDSIYRLQVTRSAAPDFRLRLVADALPLVRGGEAKLTITAERRGGFTGAIDLKVNGLPHGVAAANLRIADGQSATELVFKDTPAVVVGGYRLRISGSATIGARTVARVASLPAERATLALDSVLLALTLPTPFRIQGVYDGRYRWVPRGTVHSRRYRIDRGGYEGPFEVSICDWQLRHLQGIQGPTIAVPASAKEFEYPVTLPPWMEIGRVSRTVICAVGTVKDAEGNEHKVNFRSNNDLDQLVIILEPGRLDIETDANSFRVVPGQTIVLPVRLRRGKDLTGPAKIELVASTHMRGLEAPALALPAAQNEAKFTIRFAEGKVGPFNLPVILRATILDKGLPVIAETKLDFLTK